MAQEKGYEGHGLASLLGSYLAGSSWIFCSAS